MLASRLPLATGWGLLLSLATFWLLWLSINTPLLVEKGVVLKPIQFTPKIVDSPPVTRKRPDKPDRIEPETIIGPPGPVIDVPRDPPPRARPGPGTRVIFEPPPGPTTYTGGTDGDAIPWVRFEPEYPLVAERRGIEGWVIVQFSVTATGQVTDVFVVNADPPGVFDEATIDAVRRWRYRPKVEDGIPVERVGLQTLIRFNL